jgi:GDP-L-fucose synthase
MIVLGAGGFIGSHVASALNAVRSPSSLECDLRSPTQALMVINGHDIIINCAGVTSGSGAAGEGGRDLVIDNTRLMLAVFDACARAGVKKLINLSSTTGYPDRSNLRELEYFEEEPHPAYRHVGNAKRFAERLADMYSFETIFLRCSGVYGPGADYDPRTSHVIEATIRKVAERQRPLTIWGDGEDERDALHIDDMVAAIALAIKAPPGAYNLASGSGMSVNAMVKLLIDYAGYAPEIVHDLSRPKMVKNRVLNTEKVRAIMGWRPTITMERGLCSTLDWYQGEVRKCA